MQEVAVDTRLGPVHVRRLGAGPPVVAWHSLYVDGRSMLPLAQALSVDHEVVVVDGWGHGRTPGVGRRFELADCAGAAVDLLDGLGLARVDWIGNAWGGHVGVWLGRAAPTRIRSLMAICAPLQPLRGQDRVRGGVLVGVYRWAGPLDFVVKALQGVLVQPGHEDARTYVREAFTAADRAGMAQTLGACMLRRPSLEGPIPVPTLLVGTDDNPLLPEATLREQAERAGGEWVVVRGARHLAPLEAPDAVATLAREWIGRDHPAG